MLPPSPDPVNANRSRNTEIRMAPAASELTVGEVNAKVRIPRAAQWIMAIYAPSLSIAYSLFMAYQFCSMGTDFTTYVPWRVLTVMMWSTYMTLVTALVMFMHLFLPRAPFALREALVDVDMVSIGLPLLLVDLSVAYFAGHMWMFIVLFCVLAILIARVVRKWVWLVSTYN